jgi:hypothetical protein
MVRWLDDTVVPYDNRLVELVAGRYPSSLAGGGGGIISDTLLMLLRLFWAEWLLLLDRMSELIFSSQAPLDFGNKAKDMAVSKQNRISCVVVIS